MKRRRNTIEFKMNDAHRDSIFTLLYAVVLIDNRVVKVEVDLFLARVETFLITSNVIQALEAKSIISTWFVKNYKLIMSEMKSPNRETFLLNHVEKLKLHPRRQEVFNMMLEVATADDDYHIDERLFIEKASKIWNLSEE